jgi:hypothetical protein
VQRQAPGCLHLGGVGSRVELVACSATGSGHFLPGGMPLQLVGWLEGLLWIPDGDAGNSALVWSSLVVVVGLVSFRNEARAIGDGSCGAFSSRHETCAPGGGRLTRSHAQPNLQGHGNGTTRRMMTRRQTTRRKPAVVTRRLAALTPEAA